MEIDVKALAGQMTEAVRGFVARAEAAINSKIDALEARMSKIPAGPRGEVGAPGKDGTIGPAGVRGEPGERGAAGERGADGARGEAGAPGKDGTIGPAGVRGEPGERGPAGERGDAGAKGESGSEGKPGARGEPGQPGKDGDRGPAGPAGKDGADGRDGKDGAAGERGIDGKDGERGEPGARGETGLQGQRGEAGPKGERGEPGDKGAAGLRGERGERGEIGETGRDAGEYEVLPGIDEEKSYRRGTWASHNGGEIKALRNTDPIKDGDLASAGWAVMRDGVAAVVITQGDDPREISVASVLTSGTKVIAGFRIPMIVYQGVWREGEYRQGDVVTWGGSAWHSQADKNLDKPGGPSGAWKMMVKEGAKGRDAEAAAAASRKTVAVK